MNTLSVLIYLAGVSGRATLVLALCAGIALLAIGAGVGYGGIVKDGNYSREGNWERGHGIQKFWLKLAWIPAALMIVNVFVPSKDTVYAIAASEFGEQAAQSETANKAISALNAWLDRQIAEPAMGEKP